MEVFRVVVQPAWAFSEDFDVNALKQAHRFPCDADFLDALAVMPQASGIALGFDRLVMLATGAERIDQVIWTPVVET
jgi:lysyl-tRNA synthetase class 2